MHTVSNEIRYYNVSETFGLELGEPNRLVRRIDPRMLGGKAWKAKARRIGDEWLTTGSTSKVDAIVAFYA